MKPLLIFALLFLFLAAVHPAWADVPPNLPTAPCGAAQPVRIVPITATHQLPPYPPEAVKMQEQGVTLLKVVIDPAGRVKEDSLVQSSGSNVLDLAALDFVKANWLWEPMRDCKMPVSTAVSIRWSLRQQASPIDPALLVKLLHFIPASPSDYPPGVTPKKSVVMMMGILSETGTWEKINTMPASGDPALQAKSEEIAKLQRWSPPQLGGKPLGAVTVIGVIWTPPGETPIDPDQVGKVVEMFMLSQKK